jgi:hypothetical protein
MNKDLQQSCYTFDIALHRNEIMLVTRRVRAADTHRKYDGETSSISFLKATCNM